MEKHEILTAMDAATAKSDTRTVGNSAMRDKMDICEGLTVMDAETGRELIVCRLYRTRSRGNYGYQFAAALWVRVQGGEHYAAFGKRTEGCGYAKDGTAVSFALRLLGLSEIGDSLNCCNFEYSHDALKGLARTLNPGVRTVTAHFHA